MLGTGGGVKEKKDRKGACPSFTRAMYMRSLNMSLYLGYAKYGKPLTKASDSHTCYVTTRNTPQIRPLYFSHAM